MKKFVLSGAVLGVAMAIGTAQAEPLTLSETAMDQVTAGMAFVPTKYYRVDLRVDHNVRKRVDVKVRKDVESYFFGSGNVGDAEAYAEAFGHTTLAETLTVSNAYQGRSSDAASTSLSAANFDFFAFAN
jgi:hypothetical protein